MLGNSLAAAANNGSRYVLTVSGVNVLPKKVPLDMAPVRITLAGPGGTSQMTFTVEDPTKAIALPDGSRVQFQDTLSPTGIWFSGLLINRVVKRHPSGQGRITECTAIGLDWFFDSIDTKNKFKSKANVTGRNNSFTNDDDVVRTFLELNSLAELAQDSNPNIHQTATDMDSFDIDVGMSVRDGLDETADQAQPGSGTSLRRYYVDGNGLLHWYSGTEGLVPPARIADGSYLTNVLNRSGVVSFVSGAPASSTTLLDHKAYTTTTLNGGFTVGVASLCLNEQQLPAVTWNGTTGFASLSGANIHPGDTFTVGGIFRRARTGQAETLVSAGTGDYYVGFDATNHLLIQKEGTGNQFVSDNTYTSTTNVYHWRFARSPGATAVYINGQAITGTDTARTFVAAAGAVNIGRKLSTTDTFLKATTWGHYFSANKDSASTVLADFNQWISLSAEGLQVETSSGGVRKSVYIKGHGTPGQPGGVGYGLVPTTEHDPFPQNAPRESPPSYFPHIPRATLDRPDSTTAKKRNRIGYSFLLANNSPTRSITFDTTYDCTQVPVAGRQTSFRPGQLLVLTDDANDLSGVAVEIKQVDIDLNLGNYQTTFSVTADALGFSALRRMLRKQNRGRQ
jgi:hypothetical protein